MSVRRTQAEIDSAEFTQWYAYFMVEPFGISREALEFAKLEQRIHHSYDQKGAARNKVKDYLFNFGKRVVQRQSVQDMKMMLGGYLSAMGHKGPWNKKNG